MQHTLYTCAECPFCAEGNVEEKFYCHYTKNDDPREREIVVFDAIPDWCPIRVERLVVRVHGGV